MNLQLIIGVSLGTLAVAYLSLFTVLSYATHREPITCKIQRRHDKNLKLFTLIAANLHATLAATTLAL